VGIYARATDKRKYTNTCRPSTERAQKAGRGFSQNSISTNESGAKMEHFYETYLKKIGRGAFCFTFLHWKYVKYRAKSGKMFDFQSQ
jgi:hypothetical protein